MLNNRKGFTLIELLVVIAIIAILAAILFPAFVAAKERGKISFCMNNLKSIYLGLTMYADDYNGALPRDPNPTNWSDVLWSEQIKGFGDMWNYVKKDNVFFCPAAKPPRTSVTNPEPDKRDVEILYKIYHKNPIRTTYMQGSYHFWPQLFRVGNSDVVRLDANLLDPALAMNTSTSFTDKTKETLRKLGGPLADNFLHNLQGDRVKNQRGVLMLNLKGQVRFLPANGYPFDPNYN